MFNVGVSSHGETHVLREDEGRGVQGPHVEGLGLGGPWARGPGTRQTRFTSTVQHDISQGEFLSCCTKYQA